MWMKVRFLAKNGQKRYKVHCKFIEIVSEYLGRCFRDGLTNVYWQQNFESRQAWSWTPLQDALPITLLIYQSRKNGVTNM